MLELLFHMKRLATHVKYVVGCENVGNGCFNAFWSKSWVPTISFLSAHIIMT